MISSFRHKCLEAFFRTGTRAGITARHAARLRLQLGTLNTATGPADMDLPGWRLHPLRGERQGSLAVRVDRTWRLVFPFHGTDTIGVDQIDYH